MDNLNDRLTAANARIKAANITFNPQNPSAYGTALGRGFNTAAMYDVNAPQAKQYMASTGASLAQYNALRSAAQRARQQTLQNARQGQTPGSNDFKPINASNILTPEEMKLFDPTSQLTTGDRAMAAIPAVVNTANAGLQAARTGYQQGLVPGVPAQSAAGTVNRLAGGMKGVWDFVTGPSTPQQPVNTSGQAAQQPAPTASGVFQQGLDTARQRALDDIRNAATNEIMTRDNPYIRQLLAEASVPYMENKFKTWFGDDTALGRGAQSIGNLLVGLLSKVPGYEWAVNKGVDMFNPELLSSLGIKTSSHRLPAYGHYVIVGKVAGNDILSRVTRELS